MTSALQVAAPAKVNLYLVVGDRRSDGYHDVTTVLQTLELHDTIRIVPDRPLDVVCEPGLGVTADANLAAVAARALASAVGREPDVALHIEKRIPAGGGLGGGSADAAAVLVGLAELWGLPADHPSLSASARAVGADVPFFLAGGTALLGGRGDVVLRTLPTPELDVVLVNPGVPVPTGAAYAAFDRQLRVVAPPPDAIVAALKSGSSRAVSAALYNNMTEAAVGLAAEVGDAVALLQAEPGVLGRAVAGSGSTVFGVLDGREAAERAGQAMSARGWWATATRTTSAGASVIGRVDL